MHSTQIKPSQSILALAAIAVIAIASTIAGADQPQTSAREARGTWWSADGERKGTWHGSFEPDATTGTVSGVLTLDGFGHDGPVTISGTITEETISFGLVASASDSQVSLGAFEGVIRGTRIKGTYLDSENRLGNWEGFWHAWKGTSASSGFTDVPPATPTGGEN